jgi:hypothetical protein
VKQMYLWLRLVAIGAMTVAQAVGPAASAPAVAAADASALCERHAGLCPDTAKHKNYEGAYVGHDEPAVLFYSDEPGAGNSNVWHLRIPHESPELPTQNGTGGTWNFQQHVAFWFGMALCETQSYPNPGMACPSDSDANIKDDPDPSSPNYIGKHVGSGFLELQFYPPGWTPFLVGTSCDPTRWCAAMAVFGLSDSLTQTNNSACLNSAGEEWANFAFITLSGAPQSPPDPLHASAATFTPDPSKVLFMNAGDELVIAIHDSAPGLVTSIQDVTTGQSGTMTASIENGFAHPLFQPTASTCSEEPYAFHPLYSTSSEHTRVPWTAHSYNVAFSDEIGHFEYCNRANPQGSCVTPGVNDAKADNDDAGCLNADASLFVKIGGCIGTDFDFDGTSYQTDWSGTFPDPTQDARRHAQSFVFTSPLTNNDNYDRIAFEADLGGIEFATGCDVSSGVGCVNPPPGAAFYPIYSTTVRHGACAWQEGGAYIPGASNTFGGNSTAEYGDLLGLTYPPLPGFAGGTFFEDFRNVLSKNPCSSNGHLPSP